MFGESVMTDTPGFGVTREWPKQEAGLWCGAGVTCARNPPKSREREV